MTDMVIPSVGGDTHAYIVAQLIEHGANTSGWIQESGESLLADNHPQIDDGPLNAFDESHSDTSLTVTIDTGEGFVGGAWLARDITTDINLDASTDDQVVYVGWDSGNTEQVIIGKNASFSDDDPKIEIWSFDTDSDGVTNSDDLRQIGKSSEFGTVSIEDDSEIGRWISTAIQDSPHGEAGNTDREAIRIPGTTSDLVMSVDDGSGNTNISYNAYYDGSDWRYMVSNNDAYRIELGNSSISLFTSTSGDADDVIDWNGIEVLWNGDIIDLTNSTPIYDASEEELNQSILEGPASSLSDYPLGGEDMQDGEGSSIDAEFLQGQEPHELGGAGDWTLLDTYEDTDVSTEFSYTGYLDEQNLGEYQLYRVEVYWTTQTNQADWNELNIRLNNISQHVYHHASIRGGSLTDQQDNRFQDLGKVQPDSHGYFDAVIQGQHPPGTSGGSNVYPSIMADSMGSPHLEQLIHGWFERDEIPNRIDVFDYWDSGAGTLKIYGKDI